jgi:hypothetical protein
MRQQRVESGKRRCVALVGDDLPARMDAGVGASCDGQLNRLLADRRKRTSQLALDRAQAGLRGPAREIGPVVFEKKPAGQTSSRKTISVESDRRGPSFRIRV